MQEAIRRQHLGPNRQAGVEATSVRFEAGRVRAPGFDAPFAQVALDAWLARVQLWDAGFYATPKLSYDASAMRGRWYWHA